MIADVVVDLQYGDCGKGKVAHHLCKTRQYTHIIRYNGGCNAGHTIYHKGTKFITHHIPCGVFFGIKSIIGPGCVIHPETFFKELDELEAKGIQARNLVKIASNAHIITDFHKAEDKKDEDIGTTKQGVGPSYRDKYGRKGVRVEEDPQFESFVIDLYEELYESNEFDSEDIEILFEGAQGFGLDIDWGDYPFVTSSHCTVGSAILNGVPPKCIRDVWGVAKIYETYVGSKIFEGYDEDDIFDKIRQVGQEFGSTTGRPRQVNWLDMNLLKKSTRINGVSKLVFNKMDILELVNKWRVYEDELLYEFKTRHDIQSWLEDKLHSEVDQDLEIFFSDHKEYI